MGNLSKSTKISLLVSLIVGVILAAILGFWAGTNTADRENTKKSIKDNSTQKESKTNKTSLTYDVTANNELEFVNYIKGVNTKFTSGEANEYNVIYDKFKITFIGKNSLEFDGYNIKEMKVYYNGNLISKEVTNGDSELGYSNTVEMLSTVDGLYVIIMYAAPANDYPASYVIAFNNNGNVLLNDETKDKYYYIKSTVINNNEIKEFGYKYYLVPELYAEGVPEACDENYLGKIAEFPLDTLFKKMAVYGYVDGNLVENVTDSKTIADDKIARGCA